MLQSIIRWILVWLRVIRKPDFSAKLVSVHPVPKDLKPEKMLIVGGQGFQKWACFQCPGGCGEKIQLSLNQALHPCWAASIDRLGRPTLHPSVRQLNECKCHFWIREGTVHWCADSGKIRKS